MNFKQLASILSISGLLFLLICKSKSILLLDNEYRFKKSVKIGNHSRFYILVFPKNYYRENKAFPLMIAMHGGSGSGVQMETRYGLPEISEKRPFIMIYPDGLKSDGLLGVRTWNAGTCCEYAQRNNIDDVGFLKKVIEETIKDNRVDSKRVFAIVMSNGGMMAYRLGCDLSDKIRAIAPVACSNTVLSDWKIVKPIPVLPIHSVNDKLVPFEGGEGIRGTIHQSVLNGLESWVKHNVCVNSSPKVVVNDDKFKFMRRLGCGNGAEIHYYLTKGGCHSLPGINKVRVFGDDPSKVLNANEIIFDIFDKF